MLKLNQNIQLANTVFGRLLIFDKYNILCHVCLIKSYIRSTVFNYYINKVHVKNMLTYTFQKKQLPMDTEKVTLFIKSDMTLPIVVKFENKYKTNIVFV